MRFDGGVEEFGARGGKCAAVVGDMSAGVAVGIEWAGVDESLASWA